MPPAHYQPEIPPLATHHHSHPYTFAPQFTPRPAEHSAHSARPMRPPNSTLARLFKLADRTGELKAAWIKLSKPTSCGNVQRQYKEHCSSARTKSTGAPARAAARGPALATPRAKPTSIVHLHLFLRASPHHRHADCLMPKRDSFYNVFTLFYAGCVGQLSTASIWGSLQLAASAYLLSCYRIRALLLCRWPRTAANILPACSLAPSHAHPPPPLSTRVRSFLASALCHPLPTSDHKDFSSTTSLAPRLISSGLLYNSTIPHAPRSPSERACVPS